MSEHEVTEEALRLARQLESVLFEARELSRKVGEVNVRAGVGSIYREMVLTGYNGAAWYWLLAEKIISHRRTLSARIEVAQLAADELIGDLNKALKSVESSL